MKSMDELRLTPSYKAVVNCYYGDLETIKKEHKFYLYFFENQAE